MSAIIRTRSAAPAILIFDADCGMCTRFAHSPFVVGARVERIGSHTVALDAHAAALLHRSGVDAQLLTTAMVLVDGHAVFVGARAFNRILRRRGGVSAACAGVLEFAPLRFVETLIYREIAKRRGAISRAIGAAACAIGPPASVIVRGGPETFPCRVNIKARNGARQRGRRR